LAQSMFNLTDYDADSNGWAVIGIVKTGNGEPLANFSIKSNGLQENKYQKYSPVVSIRSSSNGCLEYSPVNLGAVTSSGTLTTSVIASNTSSCRSQAASADVDSNSVPDNEQPLYRARIGELGKGEDTSKIYIERNVVAAEAILGLSDYDSDSDGWAVVGVSSGSATDSLSHTILVDSNSALVTDGTSFNSTMLGLSQSAKRAIVPMAVLSNSSSCIGLKADNLSVVSTGQTRSLSSATVPNTVSCT
jgi:hypothetical protein